MSVGDTHLDKVREPLLTSGAGEVAVIDVNGHVIFQQIQAVKGLWAENARVSLLVRMELHVALQGRTADEALVTEVTGQWAVPLPPVEAQVLVQFVLLPEGLPTLQAFEGPEGLPNKQMLKSCILKDTHKRDYLVRKLNVWLAHSERKMSSAIAEFPQKLNSGHAVEKDFSGETLKTKPSQRSSS